MIPQAHITAWRSVAPWPDDAQVEQDLVLIQPLLATGVDYNAQTAMSVVRKGLIERLTGEPWQKPTESGGNGPDD